MHEHIIVDFAGADSTATYDPAEVFRIARPKLEELKAFGCRRLLECTPNGLGRDPALLRRLGDATGIEIWTNTGLYGAAKRLGLPKYAWRETAEQLAKRWVMEWKTGVAGVKPRFIKTAVNGFPLEPIDTKLVEAAVLAALETGVPVASHTNGGGRAMEAQLDILTRLKCPLERFIWVHAQGEKDHAFHERAARAGAWCEFDGISEKSAAWHRECVLFMRDQGLLNRTLISQDAGWYHVGEPGGGNYRPYTYIYTDFLPSLPPETHQPLMVRNPLAAFGK
ncbi:MAG: phosphotriesterase [Candidatus Solibacter usitatus]|nr:phosphotriesterase [Candidatus Solibacter usitatus]